jgi:hypothetical protein
MPAVSPADTHHRCAKRNLHNTIHCPHCIKRQRSSQPKPYPGTYAQGYPKTGTEWAESEAHRQEVKTDSQKDGQQKRALTRIPVPRYCKANCENLENDRSNEGRDLEL